MSESSQERWTYNDEGDILDVYFDGFAGERPVWTIELTDNITISIDRAARRAARAPPWRCPLEVPHLGGAPP